MPPTTSVSLEGMKLAQGNFESAVQEANSQYSMMQGQIETLLASWTGEAATVFGGAMNTWLQDFAVVRDQLQLMLEKLQQNTGVYTTTHDSTVQAAGAVRNSMPAGLPGF
ncbi:MAG: hypothetical protein JWO67_6891 [Streptosporangiaceae bacterium]|jgi:WXG100 family type VII secretion target|nr:hypothetical protein [Streptosporangiaceae bacterium]